tara:strand:+ start:281 stop:1735 length:1455 start_codon:yes stop_codon:yes gene_type:complete
MSSAQPLLVETLIDKELVDYFDMATQLYRWNYYASAWHLLLFAISCISGSDNDAWRVLLAIFTAIYICNILFRKCLYGKEDEHICGAPQTFVFLGVLFVSFDLAGICGIILAAGFNNPNILPIALSTSHSGASLNNTTFNNATCKNIVRSEFRDWMDCLKNQYNCATDACVAYNVDPGAYEILGNTTDIQFVLRKGTTDVFSDGMYVWWGVSLFCIITSLFHMILAISADDVADAMIQGSNYDMTSGLWPVEEERNTKKERNRLYSIPETRWWISVPYVNWVWHGIQPMRWAEYSITASLMIVLVFIINGVTDIYLLAFSYIIMNLTNSFGAAIDYVSEQAIVAWFWACGVGAIIWQFALLLAAYSENISPYMEADTKDLWQEYFGFIPVMNWLVIITFSGFGITNIVHQYFRFRGCCKIIKYTENRKSIPWKRKCCCCLTKPIQTKEVQRELMHEFELWYIAQSFISKTILVACVLYGSVQRL